MPLKIAVIDIGTYSTRLLISGIHIKQTFEETIKNIEDILSVGRITALGRGVKETKLLQEEAINETLTILKEYVLIAQEHQVDKIIGFATQACRTAKNGEEFLKKVRELGIDVTLIDGEKEACLSFLATAFGVLPKSSFVVIDQGGGSTEYAYGKKDNTNYKLLKSESFPFGIVNLTEQFVKHDPPLQSELSQMKNQIKPYIEKAYREMKEAEELIGLGGTITTLVALEHNIYPYSSQKVHGQILTKKTIEKWLKKLSSLTIKQRKAIPIIEDKRAEAIIAGIVIFDTTLEVFKKEKLKVSDWGLRHGAVIKEVMKIFGRNNTC
ncbi:MAG: Ppx/GppA family phosphatase [Aquificae bacterium]|nr:Ppx/GppA family phosphatase [Aquificota bacterium]